MIWLLSIALFSLIAAHSRAIILQGYPPLTTDRFKAEEVSCMEQARDPAEIEPEGARVAGTVLVLARIQKLASHLSGHVRESLKDFRMATHMGKNL